MKRATILAIASIVIVAIALFSTFGSLSICSVCGCKCHTTECQLPLSSVTYWRFRNIQQTTLSELADRLRIVPAHRHDWRLIHGSGNGIMCALGTGGDLYRSCRSPQIAAFVRCTARFRGVDETAKWFQTALDKRDGKWFVRWIEDEEFPENGFDSPEAYEHWRSATNWPEFLALNRAPE